MDIFDATRLWGLTHGPLCEVAVRHEVKNLLLMPSPPPAPDTINPGDTFVSLREFTDEDQDGEMRRTPAGAVWKVHRCLEVRPGGKDCWDVQCEQTGAGPLLFDSELLDANRFLRRS